MNANKIVRRISKEKMDHINNLVSQTQLHSREAYTDYKNVLINQATVNGKPEPSTIPHDPEADRLCQATGLRQEATETFKPRNNYEDAKLNAAKI